MKSNYIIEDIDVIIKFLQDVKERYPDRVFVTGVTTGGSASAPTKRKTWYTHKLEHTFAPDCFKEGVNGINALLDGGGFYFASIPKKHINPEFLKEED